TEGSILKQQIVEMDSSEETGSSGNMGSFDDKALIEEGPLLQIQDNVGWALGFGIPTVFMGVSI
ncbi:hypothetical protein S245_020209, partial [Arachis hypogaea]